MNKKTTTFKLLLLSGVLSFNSLSAQNYEYLIADYFTSNSSKLKSASLTNKEFTISNIDHSESMNGDVLQVQQMYNSIPVYQGISTFLIKDNKVEYANENFISDFDLSKTKRISKSSIDEEQLAESLFPTLLSNAELQPSSTYKITKLEDVKGRIDTRLVYFPMNNQLTLAMEFNFQEVNSSNYWHILMNVDTKEILLKENLTVFCKIHKDAFSHESHIDQHHNEKIVLESKTSKVQNSNNTDAKYNVFPFPIEAPTFGQRSIVTEDRSISPDGWHFDGRSSYTITNGNNVFVYEDLMANGHPSHVTDAGSSLIFDYPLDINANLDTYKDAALTNMFYANNRIHDIFYKFGFTESARNFQYNNYNLGGQGFDRVIAETRKGFGTNDDYYLNNASFATPRDGISPTMSMYIFDTANTPQRIKFNSPTDLLEANFETKKARFGPSTTIIPITGDLIKSEPLDGCTELSNSLVDQIAFIERGTCNFTVKVKNAQDAGAKAVIVYNSNNAQSFGEMSGFDSSITIPSALINFQDAQQLLSILNSSTNINMTYQDDSSKDQNKWIDSSFDNGIIIHEYGHGISNRLTGNGFSCLHTFSSNEQMGEGWSDFFALMLTNQPNYNADVPRGMGTFAEGQQIDGPGIRSAKYSPDFSINNYTYGKTNGITSVHAIGFIWATMLWDLHWKFVERYGYNSDLLADSNSGSAKVLQLVMDGLKLQACNPTFIDGRDAILKADEVNGSTDRCMIWETFARRGLGVNASAGSKVSMDDQVEDFTVPNDCRLSTNNIKVDSDIKIYPNPARNEVILSSKTIKEKVNIQLFDITGKKVVEVNENISSGAKLDVSSLADGLYIIKGKGNNADFSQKLIIKK